MKKIVAFGASNSSSSINKRLATYVANQFENCEKEILDLNNYEMPIYSVDREKNGTHELAVKFHSKMREADLIIISFAEYNGSYTAAFKNIFEWISRMTPKPFIEKKLLLLATSTGAGGGQTILNQVVDRLPKQGAQVLGSFVLPSFNENFDNEEGIVNQNLKSQLFEILNAIDLS
jgi:chromate reductase, NAD(P)H dehydrogenase (quinone)